MNLKLIVAEDEALIRTDLVETLKELNFEISAAVSNGLAAIEAYEKFGADLVLLDVKMPVMDGLTAAEELIKRGACCVLLTAFSQTEIVNRATSIGVDGYIVKPWRLDNLRPTLEVAYAQGLRRMKLKNLVQESISQAETEKIISRARAILMGEHQIAEEQAYKIMQRAAMDGRRPLVDVARSIIERADEIKNALKNK